MMRFVFRKSPTNSDQELASLMKRRILFILAAVAFIVIAAAFFARGPIGSESVVGIQMPELVAELATATQSRVARESEIEVGAVRLSAMLEAKRILKTLFAEAGLAVKQEEFGEAYTFERPSSRLALRYSFGTGAIT